MHDIDTESLGKTIQGHLQLAATTKGVEKARLSKIITANQIVCDETDQTERPAMIDMFEKINGDGIKSLGYVGRLTESMPAGNQLKVSRLELQPYTGGQVVILFLVGAAMYVLAPPRTVPVYEEESAVAQTGAESKRRADRPLRASWGSTLKSLRQDPDTSRASQETGSYRQAAVYEEMPHQTDSEHINVTGDLAGSLDETSMAGARASDKEPAQWARITRPSTLHREASISSPIVGYSGPGKEVQIREYVNGWFRVQDPETQEGGWIFHKYVGYISGPTAAEAQVAATAEPSVKVASPTSQKPARIGKPAVRSRKAPRSESSNR